MFAFLIIAFVTGSKLNLIKSATIAQFNNCMAAKNSQFAIIITSQLKPDLRKRGLEFKIISSVIGACTEPVQEILLSMKLDFTLK